MKPEWSDKPTCKGWWWCFPDSECEWSRNYKTGMVVEAVEDDGHFYPDRKGVVDTIRATMCFDFVGVTGKYSGDVFGRWYGPIQPPESKD